MKKFLKDLENGDKIVHYNKCKNMVALMIALNIIMIML